MQNPIRSAGGLVRNFFSGFIGAATAILSIEALSQGFKTFVTSSDNFVSTSARLQNINDGLQTQAELQKKIYQAAQRSRSAYSDTANAVAKLNLLAKDAFKSNEEAIWFSEMMGKAFTVSGASTQEREAGMYQLTQAMAAGRLQGDEFRSIMENAPMLAQAIADFTGRSMGDLKEMSAEGTITADIIKNALFRAADDIEKKFKNMPLTFGQAMTKLGNWALVAFEPLLVRFNQFVNSDAFTVLAGHAMWFINVFIGAMSFMFDSLEWMYTIVGNIGQAFRDNWSWIAPILLVMGTILAAIIAILLVKYSVLGMIRLATMAWAAWQWVVNAAYLSSPITWVLLIIVAVIALVIYAMVNWADTTATVIGAIVGSVYWLGAVFYNTLMGIGNFGIMVAEWFVNHWNQAVFGVQLAWIGLNLLVRMVFDAIGNAALRTAEFFINIWNNGVYLVQMGFYKMQEGILTVMSSVASGIVGAVNHALGGISTLVNKAVSGINSLISLINKIPGVDIGEIGNVDLKASTAAVDKLNSIKANLAVPTKAGPVNLGSFNTAGDYMKSVNMPTAPQQVNFGRLEYKNLGDAFAKGQQVGSNASLKASEKLTGAIDKVTGLMSGKMKPGEVPAGGKDLALGSATAPGAAGDKDGKSKNPTGGKLDKIGKIEDKINIADEDLKLLLELADSKSIRAVNISLSPSVTFKDVTVREEADIDKVISKINKSFEDDMARSVEGVVT
ncbi:tape measure protein [Heyndrickxia oleronia]|uniref:tape measure protein n=1 Tax=Heyndrickxia oleronia TaxID=38875 RepID=UPI001FEF5044|nr:tape measure protein [Heyndrickxia oleronia]